MHIKKKACHNYFTIIIINANTIISCYRMYYFFLLLIAIYHLAFSVFLLKARVLWVNHLIICD